MADTEKLAVTLAVLQSNNVGHVEFHENGCLKLVVFRYPEFVGPGIVSMLHQEQNVKPLRDASILKMPERRETDIELAMNPPRDILHPSENASDEPA